MPIIKDWNKLTLKNKKSLSSKDTIFIVGGREMSKPRILKIVKGVNQGINSGKKIIFGVLKNDYILGLEGSPQFRTTKLNDILSILYQDTHESLPRKNLIVLEYFQRDLEYILKEVNFGAVIFINASWHKTIHTTKEFWTIIERKIPYKFISPFIDENEAQNYPKLVKKELDTILSSIDTNRVYSNKELIDIATNKISKLSYDHTYQTGCLISSQGEILTFGYNKVLPYETYAMHFGSEREKHFSPPGDLNNYDTVHAEIDCLMKLGNISETDCVQSNKFETTQKQTTIEASHNKKPPLKKTKTPTSSSSPKKHEELSLFINLLPCPTCAKAIALSPITKVIYKIDHSNGQSIAFLNQCGISCERMV